MRTNNLFKLFAVVLVLSMALPISSLANNLSQETIDPTQTPIPPPEEEIDMIQLADGEKAINDYLTLNNIVLDKNSPEEEYEAFLYEVLNDTYLDLWTDENQDVITYYAVNQLGLLPDTETMEVDLEKLSTIFIPIIIGDHDKEDNSASNLDEDFPSDVTARYNRSKAIAYANKWARSGGKKRNSAYPSFKKGDCTNFVSQVARAGGMKMRGGGTCGDEKTTSEWYVGKTYIPCSVSLPRWKWSTSWSTTRDFRYYMRDKERLHVEAYPANKEAVSLLISRARPGDIIQFDVREKKGGKWVWVPTHSVVVVQRKNKGGYYSNDLLYNDHMGTSNDNVKASLRAKYQSWVKSRVTRSRRMVWIKMP